MVARKSYDVFGLLSASGRDFLVRNNGHQVRITSLVGKTIGIYFVPLKEKTKGRFDETKDLIHCYNNYNPSGKFQVVLVAVIDDADFDQNKDREMFRNCFSKMPWLAIPCEDIESRERLAHLDSLYKYRPSCTILDPGGTVLTHDGLGDLSVYGTECFPFTPERFEELKIEDGKARREATLTSLLTSLNRDYLVDSKGRKVPARELEGSVVGLFFINNNILKSYFANLAKIYETLRNRGEKFEIVMVNTNNSKPNEIGFMKASQKMPWLAWPLSDKKYKRLVRLLYVRSQCMVMIGPNMEFIDQYGLDIINEYGLEAFPFTRKSAAHLEVAKMKEKSLESVLMSYGHQHVMSKTGTQVDVSELKGKSIALFMGALSCKACNDFLDKLIEWYGQIKMKDHTFEIIYVSWDKDEDSYHQNCFKMPWLALPFQKNTKKRDSFNWEVFKAQKYDIPLLVAFGSDGKFLTKNATEKLLVHGLDAYPFNDDELLEDTLRQIISVIDML